MNKQVLFQHTADSPNSPAILRHSLDQRTSEMLPPSTAAAISPAPRQPVVSPPSATVQSTQHPHSLTGHSLTGHSLYRTSLRKH